MASLHLRVSYTVADNEKDALVEGSHSSFRAYQNAPKGQNTQHRREAIHHSVPMIIYSIPGDIISAN
jgi:hypothetical protein